MESQQYELLNSFINNSHSDNAFNEYELPNMSLEKVLTLNNSTISIKHDISKSYSRDDIKKKIENFESSEEEDKKHTSNKFLKYFENNSYNNREVSLADIEIKKKKKKLDEQFKNIYEKMKCKGCSKMPNEFFICKICGSLYCENCKEKVNNKKMYCNSIKCFSKPSFELIKIPILEKLATVIELERKNNEDIYIKEINNNIKNNIIYCSEKIHDEKDGDFEFKEEINKYKFKKKNVMKAIYFCMECQRPFCSDCILNYKKSKEAKIENEINEEGKEKEIKHNSDHIIFRIDFLANNKIFDLLYENKYSQNIISSLESLDAKINTKIDELRATKVYMIEFIDSLKKIYMSKIDELINKLNDLAKEKIEKINKIKAKCDELYKFIPVFKTSKDFQIDVNKIKINKLIEEFTPFHEIPDEINKKFEKLSVYKGLFNLLNIYETNTELKLKSPFQLKSRNDKYKIDIRYYKNNASEKEKENEKENEVTKKNENIQIKVKVNSDKNKKKINFFENKNNIEKEDYLFVFNNNNKNLFSLLKKKKEIKQIKKEKEKEKEEGNEIRLYNPNNPFKLFSNKINFIQNDEKNKPIKREEEYYYTEINVNEFKKTDDDYYNINFLLYNFKLI